LCLLYVYVIRQCSNQYPFCALTYTCTCLVHAVHPRDTIFNVAFGDLSTTPCTFARPVELFEIVECCGEVSNTCSYLDSIYLISMTALNQVMLLISQPFACSNFQITSNSTRILKSHLPLLTCQMILVSENKVIIN
jgi:hypothetical protein